MPQNLHQATKGKWIFVVSILSLLFFTVLMISSEMNVTYPQLVGAALELTTLPVLTAQVVFLVITFVQWRSDHYKKTTFTFWAMVIFFIITIVCFGSIVFSKI